MTEDSTFTITIKRIAQCNEIYPDLLPVSDTEMETSSEDCTEPGVREVTPLYR